MDGMNLIFHIVSAVVLLVLVGLLLKAQRERDFLRELMRQASAASGDGGRRVIVDNPERFLQRYARCLGVDFDAETSGELTPVRIHPGPWARLLLETDVRRLRVDPGESQQSRKVTVTIAPSKEGAIMSGTREEELTASLGAQVAVRLQRMESPEGV